MEAREKALARLLFQRAILRADGQAYEDLFTTIMSSVFAGFRQIKPQGRTRDRKNDGYSPVDGCYFQVFAPESPRASVAAAVNKLKTDFAGLRRYWQATCPVRSFRFAFNDKYQGSFPTIEKALAELKREYQLAVCDVLLAKDLEDLLLASSDDVIIDAVGFIPDPSSIVALDYSVLSDVVRHLLSAQRPLVTRAADLTVPDFSDKIRFNGLTEPVAALLTTASFHAGPLDDYFRSNSVFAKQEAQRTFVDLYVKHRHTATPDQVFFKILEEASPARTKAVEDTVLVLMAFYFEACDIFDAPPRNGHAST